jgi:hypothetical protein
MADSPHKSIPKDKFLVMSVNLLHRQFIEAGRTEAKRDYREIAEGRSLVMTSVQMEDNSKILFRLSLDQTEFAGDLRFSAFRTGLNSLLANISMALQEEKDVPVFTQDDQPGCILFGISSVTVQDDRVSVLALGADMEGRPGTVTLRLMYLDPSQFTTPAPGDASGPATA